ncbi:histidine phosphatase family protein [candidate division WOR-3 bacterium]|nr:histidine phosphatase family protein [candidate division WOR-3 bacterium]
MTKISFVRHGQSTSNCQKRLQGQGESDITELGLLQAQSLERRLKNSKFDFIYSSPLKRALKTAEVITKKRCQPIIRSDLLKEINLGIWEGKLIEDIQRETPKEYDDFNLRPHIFAITGGETFEEVQKRAEKFLNYVSKEHKDKSILAFSHGVLIRTACALAEKKPLSEVWNTDKIDNTSITVISVENGNFKVTSLGEDSHLHLIQKETSCMN